MSLTMPRTTNQVASVAMKPTLARRKIGLASPSCLRLRPAVIAARTRMLSRPSRKTRTLVSRMAERWLVFGRVGSGFPLAVTPCQMRSAMTGRRVSATRTQTRRCQLADVAGREWSCMVDEDCMPSTCRKVPKAANGWLLFTGGRLYRVNSRARESVVGDPPPHGGGYEASSSNVPGVGLVLDRIAGVLPLEVDLVFLQVGVVDVVGGHAEDLGHGDEKVEEIDDFDLGVLGIEFLVFRPPFPGHAVDEFGDFLRHGARVVEEPFGLFLLAHAGGAHADALVQRLLHPEQFLELILGRFTHAGIIPAWTGLTRLTGLGGGGFSDRSYMRYMKENDCPQR